MNFLDNHKEKHMTLDNKTFLQCSKRMQRLTPTLPRKHLQIKFAESYTNFEEREFSSSVPLDDDKSFGDEREKKTFQSLDNVIILQRPTPPPRIRKKRIIKMNHHSEDFSNHLTPIRSHSQKVTDLDEDFEPKKHFESNMKQKQNYIGNIGMEEFSLVLGPEIPLASQTKQGPQKNCILGLMKRPTKSFVNWMSNIADNFEIHSYPI